MSDALEGDTDVMEAESGPVVTTMTEPKSKTAVETRTKRMPPYNVIILNDEEHTFDYVIKLLMKLLGHPLPVAEELALRIHHSGRAVVYTTHKEKAELKRDQIITFGPDPECKDPHGPLGCYIEPAPSD